MAHRAVVNPNRQAPQPQAPPPTVCLHPLRSRRLDTRYIGWIAIRQRVASVVADPSFEVEKLSVDRHAHYGRRRLPLSQPFAFKTDFQPERRHHDFGPRQRREGGGLCHNYFSHENSPIYRVTISHVTRYQLMSWMVAFGRLILPDGLSRCDRDWFAVTRYARRVTVFIFRGGLRVACNPLLIDGTLRCPALLLVIPLTMVLALEKHGRIAGMASTLGGDFSNADGRGRHRRGQLILQRHSTPMVATIALCARAAFTLSRFTPCGGTMVAKPAE